MLSIGHNLIFVSYYNLALIFQFVLLVVVVVLILFSVLLLDGGSETFVVRKRKNKTSQNLNKKFPGKK